MINLIELCKLSIFKLADPHEHYIYLFTLFLIILMRIIPFFTMCFPVFLFARLIFSSSFKRWFVQPFNGDIITEKKMPGSFA